MKKRFICLGLSMILLLSGCGHAALQPSVSQTQTVQDNNITQTVQMPAYKAEITYELPVSRVNVLVDRNGYLCDRDKRVLFLGEDLAHEFRIVREDTREVVYTGEIAKTSYDKDRGFCINRGDFTDFTTEGSYYIEMDRIGRSYTFTIGNHVYDELFDALMAQKQHLLYGESAEDICKLGLGMHSMLLALQCHGAVFEQNKTFVPQLLETADWMLTRQDNASGSVDGDYEATAVFCGIMAMYTNVFGKYDEGAAKSYLTASRRAWKWLEQHKPQNDTEKSARYYAAAQLFRADGHQSYHTVVLNYFKESGTDTMKHKYDFYAAIVYLGTERGTDRDICTKLMQELVDETETICVASRKDVYGVYDRNLADNLYKVLLVCFVDYITPSNEYETVIENTLHYIEGRNETGVRYLGGDGTWVACEETKEVTSEWSGIVLLCLSDLLSENEVNATHSE